MRRRYWTDQENPDKLSLSFAWRVLVALLAALAVCGIVGGVIWGIKVITSDVRGAGDQTRIVNDANNRINAQQWFHDQYGQIRSTDGKLDPAYVNLQAALGTPDENVLRVTYTGLLDRCIDMREQYNSEAQKVTRQQWRDPQLPTRIDESDPATDCQPSTSATATRSPR